MSPYSKYGYDYTNARGLFKIVLDKEGNEIFKKYFLWEEASNFIEMNEKGKTKDGRFQLSVKSYFIFKDGTVSAVTEKRKENVNVLLGAVNVKTTGFVILNFDKDFKLTSTDVIEKDMSKWTNTDFLFSQYIKDGNGAVFLYNDFKKDAETREKNWILGII